MTIEEAYGKLGGNYEDMSYRVSDQMILRLIGMLLKDPSHVELCSALEQHDYETAFRGAHTLKGVALNLGLTPLADKASALTEVLRNRQEHINIDPVFSEFEEAYKNMNTVFLQLLASSGGDVQ